ncbi:mitochondrial ribosomal protein S22 [Brevipalpus obovatus]|uniref:mitochondrial ribosomal protein S22 n=1 Tax=Brevipalpus obovatus TaxID=246614 RepID=UPI003D9DFA95
MLKPTSKLRLFLCQNGAQRISMLASPSSSCSLLFNRSVGNSSDTPKELSTAELFLHPKVQRILKSITGFDVDKVFAQKPVKEYKSPKYLFLTDEELEMTRKRSEVEGAKTLEMPPVMDPLEEEEMILERAPEWKGFDYCKLIFTDISAGYTDRTRLIVVRDPDGTLRRANWEERYRMNQTYFPVNGRSYLTPKMFEEENLQKVLDRHDYKFVLDRACIQFEPDDPRYIEITRKTYDHIDETQKYDELRSTRQFGPLAFYLTRVGRIDGLLIDMIKRELINDAAELVQLFYILNPIKDRAFSSLDASNSLVVVEYYLKTHSKRRQLLDSAIREYRQTLVDRASHAKGNRENQKLSAKNG